MVSYDVKQGLVGCGHSCMDGLFLLQVTDDHDQARAVLTEGQLRELIERLKKLLPIYDVSN